ncbi:fumarylacetoacetate hydrolase family protein [Gordonia rubripertincta]|uniref:Fumarylacetoacetate hydrolase family protein n=2 Tax=Gordonia rubripertincta TaxID=36822 RepID=A0AAW6RCM4_GORRU|nr:fumarylacetoacetate hydrolase family protein [Gordonia rubripertincta]MDG6783698.1 fumarylacetoacetate hydrolase family protein [Gordonia rubripertincta]NKY65772.1 2-keto-4-pentenoate hydratase [Gordonia rubripertincta]GAB84087.1 putative 2-hydroxypenta-2,4-dienoate hydratase [Gordonia rubripertincta NBRC 101908]
MTSDVQSAVAGLLGAYDSKIPIEPIAGQFADQPLSVAYEIAQAQVQAWEKRGDVVKGHKVGLASRAIQQQMGVDQPDFGHLTASMFHLEHDPIAPDLYIQPRIEPEIAFVLGQPLRGPGVTVADAARAVDFVLPALEIVDSRIRDWKIGIFDTIADNASSGGVVLGSTPVQLSELDLRLAGCALHINGELVATGAGGAVLGSPLNALVWLANTVGPLGVTLEPGHVVLPGSMTKAFPVTAGSAIVAEVLGLGSVTAVVGKDN